MKKKELSFADEVLKKFDEIYNLYQDYALRKVAGNIKFFIKGEIKEAEKRAVERYIEQQSEINALRELESRKYTLAIDTFYHFMQEDNRELKFWGLFNKIREEYIEELEALK